jgi:hypothetical protein
MNSIKIINGKVELRNDSDSLIKILGDGDIIRACLNESGSLILTTTISGNVELFKEDGTFIRTIGNGNAKSAAFYRNNILVVTNKDSAELRGVDDSIKWVM